MSKVFDYKHSKSSVFIINAKRKGFIRPSIAGIKRAYFDASILMIHVNPSSSNGDQSDFSQGRSGKPTIHAGCSTSGEHNSEQFNPHNPIKQCISQPKYNQCLRTSLNHESLVLRRQRNCSRCQQSNK